MLSALHAGLESVVSLVSAHWDDIAVSLAQAGATAPGDGATPAPARLDPVALVLNASAPVKAVLVILVFFSMACWVVIGAKTLHLRRARSESKTFLTAFDKATTLESLARDLGQFRGSPYARIFAVGYDEMVRLNEGRPRLSALDRRAGRRTSRASRAAPPLSGSDAPRVVDGAPRHDRFDVPVHRPLRHGLRHHGRVPQHR